MRRNTCNMWGTMKPFVYSFSLRTPRYTHQLDYYVFHVLCRQEFDFQTDKLQQCLRSLDRRVTMTIIAAVCTAFADVDTPLHNLITAATSPMPVRLSVAQYVTLRLVLSIGFTGSNVGLETE